MTYERIKQWTEGKEFPVAITNEKQEIGCITFGENDGIHYYKIMRLQRNNWIRIEYFYEDGTVEELYER